MNLLPVHMISRAAGIFIVVTVLQFISSFFLLPLYLHHYSVENFGVNEIINRVSLFVGFIISLRISGAMANVYFTFKEAADQKQFVSTLAAFTLLTGFLGLLIFSFAGQFFIRHFFSMPNFFFWPHGCCALLTAIAANFFSPYLFYLRNEQQLKKFLYINFFLIGTNVTAQLVSIYLFSASFNQIIAVRSGIAILQCIVMIIIYYKQFSFKINTKMLPRALKYTAPLIPFLILNWLQLYFDRFFISSNFGAISLGIFSFILIIGNVHSGFTDAVENSFRPFLVKSFASNNKDLMALQKLQSQFIRAIILSASIALLCAIALPLFVQKKMYLEHSSLLFLVVATTVCKGFSLLFIQQLVYKEKSVVLGIAVFIHFVATWFCYEFFSKKGDIRLVLLINLMLNFLMTFIYYRLAQVIFFIRFSINQFMIPLTFILLLVAAYYFEERKLLSFNQLAVLQFIFITVLYFGAKAKQKIRQIKAI